jgi:hypothetical protein
MTRSVLQPIRSRRVTPTASRSQLNPPNSKVPSLTPATRKTLATIGALWVSFAVTASANASRITTVAPASTQPKMVVVSPAPSSLIEQEHDHISRTENDEMLRRKAVAPSSTEGSSKSETKDVVFVSNGKRPDSPAPQPPTPESRPQKDDATAIIAYLMLLSK